MSAAEVPSLVSSAAAATPDRAALDRAALVEPGGRTLTWAQLDDEVARVATGLGVLGVLAGHRVVVVAGNRVEHVTTYLGVLRAQAVAVPADPAAPADELARLLDDCTPRLVVADDGAVATAREAVARHAARGGPTPLVVVVGAAPLAGERSYEDLRAGDPRPLPPLRDPERLAVVLYTGGASGPPRGAMLSHRALLANIEQVAAVDPPMITGDDVVLGLLPLFHVYGLGAVLGAVLRRGATLVLVPRYDPEGTLDLVAEHRCTVVPAAPVVLEHWRSLDLGARLASVRLVLSGSAPLPGATLAELVARTGIPVHQGYGLTEAAPVVTTTLRSADPEPGSLGAPLEGVEVRLVDEGGAVLRGDDPGRLQVRGANLFSGYWPDGADGPDAEGWWDTGDVAIVDPAGEVRIVDRVADVVVVSGFTVYPAEVEHVVREVPGVESVAVIGVEDAATGAAVVAYVVASGDRDAATTAEAVRSHCEERLAAFKVPVRVEVVERLPRTPSGQVQKGRLRGRERRRARELLA